jgi:hypothetical protein
MTALLRTCLVLLAVVAFIPVASAYSVLTHEAIIDTSWPREIKPLLLKRFPNTTEDELRQAHAYAYGGAILQDMGYYPFGNKFFSDLLHYVRTGDFILALLADAQDVDEYAFALGSLAHYASDNDGHPIGVNRAVPLVYPKLREKYGAIVTYEDDPAKHLKTEFGFDVIQVARGQYASQTYHDFIGFQVSKPLLERAFQQTYSLELDKLFRDLDLALGTYRYSVSKVIPEMTKAAWAAKKDEIAKLQAGITRRKFLFKMSRAAYHKEWDRKYEQPGPGARFLAWLFRILPKIGPLRALAFKVPPPAAEKLFLGSVDDTISRYRQLILEVNQERLRLVNENFDIGKPTHHGEYRLADETYAKLLEQFSDAPDRISDDLRANILAFYDGSDPPSSEKARGVLVALRGAAPAFR